MPSQVLKVLRFDRGERTEISPSCAFSGEGSAHKPTEGAEFRLALPENHQGKRKSEAAAQNKTMAAPRHGWPITVCLRSDHVTHGFCQAGDLREDSDAKGLWDTRTNIFSNRQNVLSE